MSRSASVRSTLGVLLASVVTVGLLVSPYALTWGSREKAGSSPGDLAEQNEWRKFRQLPRFTAVERVADLSPFGPGFKPEAQNPDPKARKNKIETAIGYIDLKHADQGVTKRLPAALRHEAASIKAAGSKGRGHAQDVNIVQVSADALQTRGTDDIESALRTHGRVLDQVPERGYLIRTHNDRELAELAAEPFVEAIAPYEPGYKIAPGTGRMPLMEGKRAKSTDLDLIVSLWADATPEAARGALEAIAGKGKVSTWSLDGTVLNVKGSVQMAQRLAKDANVRSLSERHEFVLTNSETPTLLMLGQTEFSDGMARPYHEVGVDGGGIDTNADGRRLNNDTDTVPPQIVVVTDNGISVDAVHFSQTLTQTTTITNPIGSAHRKVHAIQNVTDSGNSCDAVLSGSNTHGNVVAGIIAGAPGDFGLTFSKAIDPADGPGVSGVSMDALARGSRIIMQDAGQTTQCLLSDLVEAGGNISPGNIADRLTLGACPKSGGGAGICAGVSGGGNEAHLHVLPFGVPNFDNVLNNVENGTYSLEARQVDLFLVNNRDYMVFSPVGSQGNNIGTANAVEEVWPDLFDGTALDNDPNDAHALQIPPPATAKNPVTVGGSSTDLWTVFGDYNDEENPLGFSSKGPATAASLRTVPLVTAPGTDGSGLFAYPLFNAAATNRSRDNDNNPPVEQEIDEANTGTSFSAGFATAAGAIVRDYFAQGFYPTGTRQTADRNPQVSGSLVRASLVASANFLEYLVNDVAQRPSTADMAVFQSRGANVGTVSGVSVGLLGNFVQGYGRIVLDSVLPISNIPPTIGFGGPDTIEYPAAGLIVYDMLATGEPPINNTTNTLTEKTFTVDGVNAAGSVGSTRSIQNGQLRIALSWPDPPSTENSGGTLINDLDLEVESPGPDNNIATTADNVVYDGNNYISGLPMPVGQWGQGRAVAGTPIHDTRNNIEAMHLSSLVRDVGNQLRTGTWKVRVKRGLGGATPGQITGISGANEDTNGNGRFDAGEPDTDGDGLLDAGGQPFALIISGPVFGAGSQTWNAGAHALPASVARLDKLTYSCSDDVRPYIFDPDGTAGGIQTGVTFQVFNAAGVLQDTETGFAWMEVTVGSHIFRPLPIPVRPAIPGIPNNGVIEGDNGLQLIMTYADAPRPAEARGRFMCNPNIVQSSISIADRSDPQALLVGGCDRDQFLDSGERMTYAIALRNFERDDDLTDVEATLTPVGASASFIRILDSPKNIGRVPGGQTTGITFTILVDPALPQATQAQPLTLVLALDGKARGVRLNRTTYSFTQAVNADKEALHYSTDFPNGGREVRDFNRNLQIDRPDVLDPFKGVYWPDEDVTFSTMFVAASVNGPFISNLLGEDTNNDGDNTDVGEGDIIPNNGTVDRGILNSAVVGDPLHKIPFDFDRNNGGWLGLRHPDSKPGISVGPLNVWEYTKTGACGAQSTIADGNPTGLFQAPGAAGIWHTGDTNPATPSAQICDEYPYPNDPATPAFEEVVLDILVSPIIAKVNQRNDTRGFPYVVEFQRLGINANIQTADYAGGGIDFDMDVDRDQGNCLLCNYMYLRFGGDNYTVVAFNAYNYGIDPVSTTPQRTFGPLTDPNNSVATGTVTGDETGFTGFTANTNPDSASPIPVALPDFRPFPSPGAPQVCAPGCGNPALCCEQNTPAGPERNMDVVLLDFEDGLIYLSLGLGQGEPTGAFAPGPAGNRWQIGVSFWVSESTTNDTDYGLGVDDVVLEWDESHPIPEVGGAACTRFGGAGQPAGQQCATLNIDRLTVYECNEALGVTVYDPRRAGTGAVTVFGVTDTDANLVSTGVVSAKHPRKSFSIPEVAGTPGLFKGNITVGTLFDNTTLLFTSPGGDTNMTFYYLDPECDGDRDGAAGENSFSNLDNDNVSSANDNCPFLYNPLQEDGDGDNVGNLCDNCPGVSNNNQIDSDADGVGDTCDFDDVDFDGVVNALDNCPDVYNAAQIPGGGQTTKGEACAGNGDRDGDGVADKLDNCVRTANPTQSDSDGDLVGNACDGDCGNPQQVTLGAGTCVRSNTTVCTADGQCPVTGHCTNTPTTVCTASNQCQGSGNVCVGQAQETCQRQGVTNNGTCGNVEDDVDADGVTDAIDNCPVVSNPSNLPGAVLQMDADSDGRGDVCDPPQTVDDDNNGIPDDAVTFNSVIACRKLPLASIVVLATSVADVGGDGDPFADAGETARMSLVLRNASGFDLTNATLVLGTIDPDVACVTKSTILIPLFPDGATLDTATLGNPAGRFEYVISSTASTTNPASPSHADFLLSVVSNQVVGTTSPIPISTVIDLDLPSGGLPPKVLGPDNLPGTADDGLIVENFETERDGTPGISISNLPRGTAGVLNDTIGVWVGTAPGGINTLSGVGCAGFIVPPQDPECRVDPDNDMDWHIHCPAGTCPNSTGFITPTDGAMSKSTPNSLHWGHHFDSTSRDGDSVKFRQLAAFQTDAINLTPLPAVGDLELSFFHIADMMDNNSYNLPTGMANDFGDVQIQTFDPSGGGAWGFWDRLAPFQNVYDHVAYIWSAFGTSPTYCVLTPADTGSGGYAPRGVKETLCFPNGIWSHCGNSRDATNTGQCDGPGETGASGPGLWVQSKFSLANFLGQTVRIRWIAEAWEFDCCSSSYYELGAGWAPQTGDEGWWIDDIRISGALQASALPPADTKAPGPGACPATACNSAAGDGGFTMDLTVTEADLDSLYVGGEQVVVSAAATLNPGGCVGGGTQYRFFKNGTTNADVVQDWSSDPTFVDNPTADAVYRVQARCSVFMSCTSTIASAASTESIQVYSADGQDINLTLTHAAGTTTIQWLSRQQSVLVSGYDFFIGTINSGGDPGQSTLAGLACSSGNIAQVLPVGTPISRTDAVTPALGTARYYLAGHSPLAAGGQAALGRRSNATLRPLAPVCP
jgi:hypothetical protein